MSEQLQVIHDDVVVAILERRDDGRRELTYSQRAIDVAEGRVLVSASLPVRRKAYSSRRSTPVTRGIEVVIGVKGTSVTAGDRSGGARLGVSPGPIVEQLRPVEVRPLAEQSKTARRDGPGQHRAALLPQGQLRKRSAAAAASSSGVESISAVQCTRSIYVASER